MEYPDEAVITLPRGLYGFEEERSFVMIESPHARPLIFLQSLASPDLCFLTLPVLVVDPEYRLDLAPEDLEEIAWPAAEPLVIGPDLLCLTPLTVRPGAPTTANLLAPVVVSMRECKAVQAVSIVPGYSHETPFLEPAGAALCS
jgi:flagellar assembly factor FliW